MSGIEPEPSLRILFQCFEPFEPVASFQAHAGLYLLKDPASSEFYQAVQLKALPGVDPKPGLSIVIQCFKPFEPLS